MMVWAAGALITGSPGDGNTVRVLMCGVTGSDRPRSLEGEPEASRDGQVRDRLLASLRGRSARCVFVNHTDIHPFSSPRKAGCQAGVDLGVDEVEIRGTAPQAFHGQPGNCWSLFRWSDS